MNGKKPKLNFYIHWTIFLSNTLFAKKVVYTEINHGYLSTDDL